MAELQGLYGPFAFPELLLQKLWWRREFDARQAVTADGRRVRVLASGRWNRLGGPDFRDALIELDGERVRGDVEVHLRAEDWIAHRHAADRAYDGVILHVVLFPPRERFTPGADGRMIPLLALLPLLWHDLEEYAADEAVAALLNRAEHRIAVDLAPLPPAELAALLLASGERRWAGKVRYAARRIERLGWVEACHHTALEILGYRVNRAPMLRVAGQYALGCWGEVDVDAVLAEFRADWAMQGVRPANQPRARLRQYQAWVRARPEWPRRLADWARAQTNGTAAAPAPGCGIREGRRWLGFPRRWHGLDDAITAGHVRPPRRDNLLVDGLLPLMAASGALPSAVALSWWWHGYPGDLPDLLRRGLRELGCAGTPELPAAVGPAQGLLGWLVEREEERERASASASGAGA